MSKRLLLDTCSVLWFAFGSSELSPTAKQELIDGETELFISSVTAWEIAVKWSLDRLPLRGSPSEFIPNLIYGLRLEELSFEVFDAVIAESLPWIHKDPFDRQLICQAIRHGLTIVTPDEMIRQYDVSTLW